MHRSRKRARTTEASQPAVEAGQGSAPSEVIEISPEREETGHIPSVDTYTGVARGDVRQGGRKFSPGRRAPGGGLSGRASNNNPSGKQLTGED